VNVALVLSLSENGAVSMTVSGGVVSPASTIVHVYDTGTASTLPAASVACTWNVCSPRARAL
jgi:hypothetical protein